MVMKLLGIQKGNQTALFRLREHNEMQEFGLLTKELEKDIAYKCLTFLCSSVLK
jgi:hypothetical protein